MTRKAQYVAGGHLTDVPTYMTYSSAVSRDTVRIGFLMATLNNLDVLFGDIKNAFLEVLTKSKILLYARDEQKADKDKEVFVVRALYGLNFSALQFRNGLAETLGNRIGYKSSLADPDLWYKFMTDADGFEFYSYILVYVDDISLLMKYPKESIAHIQKSFTVKPSIIKEPNSYPGSYIHKIYYINGSYGQKMGVETYVTHAIIKLKIVWQRQGFNTTRSYLM